MKARILLAILILSLVLVSCGMERPHIDNTQDTNHEIPENVQSESKSLILPKNTSDILDTETDFAKSMEELVIYQEHIKKANSTIRKICAEMAENNWERITCFHFVPEEFCEYEGRKIDFQDFRDLYYESTENPEDHYYSIVGSIPGRGGIVSQEPLLVVLILSFNEEYPDGAIRRVLYNTESGFTSTAPWVHPDGNVICDAYDALLWDEIYAAL